VVATAILLLPREIEADPACAAIRARLADTGRLLWPGGEAVVSVLPLGAALADALRAMWHEGRLVLGLEGATAALATEARGLAARPPGMRVSRLLLLSDDGAERLYRHAERLAMVHAPRVLAAVLAADGAALGRATTGREVVVKAVLAQHKQAVAALLRALTA
jgi:hypothetical protein